MSDVMAASESDAIGTFLEEQRFHGRSDRTLSAYRRVLRDFETWVIELEGDIGLEDADRRACMAWVHSLRSNHKASTVATYASYIHRFYRYMVDVGEFDANPMALVIDQMPEEIDANPMRRDVSLPAMREFVAGVRHPLERAVIVTLLKTGVRVGELCNLDLRDLHLDAGNELYGWDPRATLGGRTDALYVDGDPQRGREYNGDTRTASNKRKRATIIPVDEELACILRRWLGVRPDARSDAQPLFVDTQREWGARLDPDRVRYIVRRHAEPRGWYQTGGDAAENVTPHYFRHFFTTHMRDRTGDRGIVKYLRGDVADDIIDTYTHNWGDRVRTHYVANIYSLLERSDVG